MTTPQPPLSTPRKSSRTRSWILIWLGLWAVLLISCVTTTRMAMAPPHVPGAEFVGSDRCALCHTEISEDFEGATHDQLMVASAESMDVGCEACHGAGSLHIDSGGTPHSIVNPARSPDTCFQCHLDKRGEFNLPHAHDVHNGNISCTDCHDPHHGSAKSGGGMMLASVNDVCLQCHTAQGGPFVFEHEATREGCTTCHSPHGSVNDKMLVARNANLCLSCHTQQNQPDGSILIGGRNHNFFLPRGTCWTTGCHEAVHGSHISSSLRF